MLKRLAWVFLGLPVAVVLVALSVANSKPTQLVLDPFRPESPALAIELPLYAYLVGALMVGVLLGGASTWLSQGRWRRTARLKSQDAMRWQAEADRLTRERDDRVAGGAALVTTPNARPVAAGSLVKR
jgi:hypothetical protein